MACSQIHKAGNHAAVAFFPTNATLPTKITGTATTGNQQSVFIEDFFTSCQELTMFCHAIYAAGAIDAIGVI